MSGLLEPLIAAAAPEQRIALQSLKLPGARDERWRYSSLRALNQRTFKHQPIVTAQHPDSFTSTTASLSPRIVFVDGHYDAAQSDIAALGDAITLNPSASSADAPQQWPFAIAAAACSATLDIRMAASTASPIHLVSITTAMAQDAIVQQSLRIELAENVEASVVHHRLGDADSNALANHWRALVLADGAKLHWLETADEGERASIVIGTRAVLGRWSHLDIGEVATGAALYRHDIDITLAGAHSQLAIRGCTMVAKRRHADIHIDVRHRARDTQADIVWRGIADQRGHSIFTGQLTVEAGADGADAALSNKNLLLSRQAEVDTRPILEIHADEVKAAHGATVGRLDEQALFYLRSRGIDEAEARRILQVAFARAPLLQIAPAELRDIALAALARSLPEDVT